jgi:hypothetical protein
MYAPAAVTQFTYRFNTENHTSIEHTTEVLDGSPFVTIDFKETPFQLIFEYTYELGRIQSQLAIKDEDFLPLDSILFLLMMVKISLTFIIPNKNYLMERKKKLYRKFLILIIKKPASLILQQPIKSIKKEIDAESFDKVIEESKFTSLTAIMKRMYLKKD